MNLCVSSWQATRCMILSGLLVLAIQLLPSCSGGSCSCDWEGPVEWTLTQIKTEGTQLYLTGNLRWEPCCEKATSSEVVFKLELSGCADWSASSVLVGTLHSGIIPETAVESEMPSTSAEAVKLNLEGCVNQISLDITASDSLMSQQLTVGQLLAADGAQLGEVHLPLEGTDK